MPMLDVDFEAYESLVDNSGRRRLLTSLKSKYSIRYHLAVWPCKLVCNFRAGKCRLYLLSLIHIDDTMTDDNHIVSSSKFYTVRQRR